MPITSGEVGLGGLLVGVAGLLAGQLQAGRADARAERRLHAQWLRDRRADAYIEILSVAEQCGQWVQLARFALDNQKLTLTLPTTAEQGRAEALLRAFASPTVQDRWAAWRDTVREALQREVERGDPDIAKVDTGQHKSTGDIATMLTHLDDPIRIREREARQRLGAAVSADLKLDSAPPRRFRHAAAGDDAPLMGEDR